MLGHGFSTLHFRKKVLGFDHYFEVLIFKKAIENIFILM